MMICITLEMEDNVKSKRITVPVDEKEHAEVAAHVEKKGFDSVAAYIRMLVRDDMRAEK